MIANRISDDYGYCVFVPFATVFCCTGSQSEPVYVHKISAAFTLPVLSQAEHMAPVPDPKAILRTS